MLTLVLGGVRSGKSAHAALLAAAAGGPVTCIATGVAGDAEMRDRIAAHRAARPAGWRIVEEPLEPARGIRGGPPGTVLLDSVDSLLANHLEAAGGLGDGLSAAGRTELLERCWGRLEELLPAPELVAVSAEVGFSLLPLTPSGRAFVDLLGELNQRLAAVAGRVHLVVAGRFLVLPPPGQKEVR